MNFQNIINLDDEKFARSTLITKIIFNKILVILRQLGIKNVIHPQDNLSYLIFNIEKIEALTSIKVLQFINQLTPTRD